MLSKRLEAVAERVPQGAQVADIGCDHAYLPIALIERGQVPAAIGCDINKGPLEAARKNAARAGISSEQLALRLGDGLTALAPGEVSVVTLAGMGAGLMAEILSAAPEVVAALARIIVSPNVAPWILRRWAMDHGFAVVEETVVLENDHYYEVFALEPAAARWSTARLRSILASRCARAPTRLRRRILPPPRKRRAAACCLGAGAHTPRRGGRALRQAQRTLERMGGGTIMQVKDIMQALEKLGAAAAQGRLGQHRPAAR